MEGKRGKLQLLYNTIIVRWPPSSWIMGVNLALASIYNIDYWRKVLKITDGLRQNNCIDRKSKFAMNHASYHGP